MLETLKISTLFPKTLQNMLRKSVVTLAIATMNSKDAATDCREYTFVFCEYKKRTG